MKPSLHEDLTVTCTQRSFISSEFSPVLFYGSLYCELRHNHLVTALLFYGLTTVTDNRGLQATVTLDRFENQALITHSSLSARVWLQLNKYRMNSP